MSGTNKKGNKGAMQVSTTALVLSGIAVATISVPAILAANGKPLPIEAIGLDNARQLVVQFANDPGAFPSVPNVLDLPGPNHRVVVEFTDTTINRAKIPTVDEMKTAMTKVFPDIKSIRYAVLPNTAKPTTRIVLEMPEDLKVTPRVVKLEENSVTINLGDAVRDFVIKKTTEKGKGKGKGSGTTTTADLSSADTTYSAVAGAPVPLESAPFTPTQTLTPAAVTSSLAAPAAVSSASTSVTTTSFDTGTSATPSTQVTVNADGDTIALKPEQKLDEPTTPIAAGTKPGGSKWDWNSPVENELATKIAETKSMGDGGPMPVDKTTRDADEEALVRKIERTEAGVPISTPAAIAAPIAKIESVQSVQAVAPLRETPEVVASTAAAVPVASTVTADVAAAPVTPVSNPITDAVIPVADVPTATVTPVSSASSTRVKVADAGAPIPEVKTEVIETEPLQIPSTVPTIPVAKPVTAPVPAQEVDMPKASAPVTETETSTSTTETTTTTEAPKNTASSAALGLKLYNSAVKNHLSGKLAEAITDYKGALAANPQFAEAHSNLGLIYNQQHSYDTALGEFHKALAINPKDAITYNGIGAALRAQKDLPGAIKNWQTAVDLDPKLATAHYNLGTAYEYQKDYDKALEAYKDAVTNDYRLGEAYYRMGLILQQKHRLEDAETQFKTALKISATAEYAEDAKTRLTSLAGQKK